MLIQEARREIVRLSRLLVLRGVAAVAFAMAALMWPRITLTAAAILIAVFAFVGGVVDIGYALRLRRWFGRWWVLLLQGLVGVAFGVAAYFVPALPLAALVAFVAIWMMIYGTLSIWFATVLHTAESDWWLPLLWGLLSITLAVAAVVWPQITLAVLLGLVAGYAVIAGIVQIAAGIRLRTLPKRWARALGELATV